LRVRIKELAQEAKFIRFEENKIKSKQKINFNAYYSVDGKYLGEWTQPDKNSSDFNSLRFHRTYDVRNAARAAQLAYAFLREKPYKTIEPKTYTPAYEMHKIKKEVKRLATKFGKQNYDKEVDIWFEADKIKTD
jgi:hypothetical protein